MLGFSSSPSPVEKYNAALHRFNLHVQHTFPCTYCMYKSAIPHDDGYDMIKLVEKVASIVFMFAVISWCASNVCFLFWVLPFIPIAIDLKNIVSNALHAQPQTSWKISRLFPCVKHL